MFHQQNGGPTRSLLDLSTNAAPTRQTLSSSSTKSSHESLSPQPRSGTDVEPVIEVLAEGLPGGADVATEVPLSEHAVEVGLCGAQGAMNEFADVFALRSAKKLGCV